MDRHTHSAKVERLEVVDTGRRRRWSEDEKLKIVLESLQAPRQVSATARRHGISRSQLLQWRRTLRARAPVPTLNNESTLYRRWSLRNRSRR
jgi:transposase